MNPVFWLTWSKRMFSSLCICLWWHCHMLVSCCLKIMGKMERSRHNVALVDFIRIRDLGMDPKFSMASYIAVWLGLSLKLNCSKTTQWFLIRYLVWMTRASSFTNCVIFVPISNTRWYPPQLDTRQSLVHPQFLVGFMLLDLYFSV
jgi:hypothetical protein